jgi:hypothetical protein
MALSNSNNRLYQKLEKNHNEAENKDARFLYA